MRTYYLKLFKIWQFTGLLTVLLLVGAYNSAIYAQVLPPRPITVKVSTLQVLNFGAFVQGQSGGTVTVFPDGSRTVSGDIIQFGMAHNWTPALFLVTANLGTSISILNGPDVKLTGSNGGSMSLHIGASMPTSPFIISDIDITRPTEVLIGGTLTVGSPLANPPGIYSGEISVTFIQQ